MSRPRFRDRALGETCDATDLRPRELRVEGGDDLRVEVRFGFLKAGALGSHVLGGTGESGGRFVHRAHFIRETPHS
jgi:hypothetical protein